MNKEQMKEEAKKEYKNIFGKEHHKICEGIKCVCHKTVIDFINSQIDKAYEEGKKEGIEDFRKQIAPDFNLLKIQIETLKHLTK